jgi:hypothetical protein
MVVANLRDRSKTPAELEAPAGSAVGIRSGVANHPPAGPQVEPGLVLQPDRAAAPFGGMGRSRSSFGNRLEYSFPSDNSASSENGRTPR